MAGRYRTSAQRVVAAAGRGVRDRMDATHRHEPQNMTTTTAVPHVITPTHPPLKYSTRGANPAGAVGANPAPAVQAELLAEVNKHEAERNLDLVWIWSGPSSATRAAANSASRVSRLPQHATTVGSCS